MSDYTLNTEAAKQADNLFSKIEEKGAYLGVLTRAEKTVSRKGTKGVDFSFKADSGATADYLTIWTHKETGEQLQGFNILMAIMTCLKVRDLTATDGEVEKYDSTTQKREKVVVPLFNELMGKPLGLLLHMEQYEKMKDGFKTGETAWKPTIAAPYAADGFTASEILSKAKEATTLDKMTQALRDRPLKNQPAKPASNDDYGFSQPANTGGSFNDLEDSIPF